MAAKAVSPASRSGVPRSPTTRCNYGLPRAVACRHVALVATGVR
jgi:hypothetical protein